MERNIHIDEFDEFLKEKADQYKMYPSDKVWNNIQRSVSLTLLLLLGTAVLVDYHTHNLASVNKILTFNSNHFKGATPPIVSGNSLIESTTPLATNDADKAVFKPVFIPAPLSEKITQTVKPSLYHKKNDNSDNSYADNEGLELADSDKLTDRISAKPKFESTTDEDAEDNKINKVLWGGEAFKKSKFEWQLFFSPTVSYRKLTSDISEVTDVFRGVPYNTTQKSTSVDNLVTHKPAVGAEVGANVIYKLTDNFILRAGLQLNYSRYQLRAYASKPEQTTLAVVSNPLGTDSINVISTLQNLNGNGSSWFNNEYFQVSLPVGFEWGVLGNSTLKWNIAASAQPVYNFANNVYLLSTDFKRYGQEPSLIRKWNINAGVETYVSYNMGSFKWQAGPQLRYQLMSSYKSEYPVKEYLVDFGFKIGVTKTIR